jgi:hypothetical protein
MRGPLLAGLLAIAAGTLSLAACPVREASRGNPERSGEEPPRSYNQFRRDIDILFVIDNSLSMRQEQESLARNFGRFVEVLENLPGGLPSVHIGVISSDIGIGSHIEGCDLPGDDGVLQATPRVAGCTPPADPYIVDVSLGGGNRMRNYGGALADSFSCIAQLGTAGCGFEQPLEAMKRALDGSNPRNAGFYRANAYLAVIVISDEDDCSAHDSRMFTTDETSLGPLGSFRCFEYGIQCEPDTPRIPGERRNCRVRTDSPYLKPVELYVDFLKRLKHDPRLIITAGVIGNPGPVTVVLDGEGEAVLAPSCESPAGQADPAVRLAAFLDAFPQRGTRTTICNDDLSGGLIQIAERMASTLQLACIDGQLTDTEPGVAGIQPDCVVSDVLGPGAGQMRTVVPPCNDTTTPASSSNVPCWHAERTPACSATPTGLTLVIERGGQVPATGPTEARCLLEVTSSTANRPM